MTGNVTWNNTNEYVLNGSKTFITNGPYADTIVFMDLPRSLCIYRVLKRGLMFRNQTRPDMTPGCNERVEWQFIRWLWSYPATRRPGILARLREERAAGKRVVRLRSSLQVRRFVASLPTASPRGERSPAR